MAFPKKGFRKITVGHQHYIWKTRGNDYYITLTVALPGKSGQLLIACIDYHTVERLVDKADQPTPVLSTQPLPITPYIIRQVIDYALKQSWNPHQSGPPYYMGSIDNLVDLRLSDKEFILGTVKGGTTLQT